MADPENKPFLSRRVVTFLGCVLLAGIFWLLHQLSKEYTILMKVPVTYLHLEDKQLLSTDLPDSVEAEVSGSGFTIFASQWTSTMSPLELDMKQARILSNGNLALTTNNHSNRIEGTVGHGFRIIHVMPDTIIVSLSGKISKQVPVIADVKVDCAPMFRIADSVFTDPILVTVTGAPALIERIKFISTEKREYRDLDRSVNEDLHLLIPSDFAQASFSNTEVNLRINIGKYTEATVTIPLEQVNVPSDVIWRTFPDKVKITFLVPVEDYVNIDPSQFRVVADYNQLDQRSGIVPVTILRQPLNIRDAKVSPSSVEFIIRK